MKREEVIVLIGFACVSLAFTTLIEAPVYGRALQLRLGRAARLSGLPNLASALGCIPLGLVLGGSEYELVPLTVYWRWSTLGLIGGSSVIEWLVLRWRLPDRPSRSLAVAVLLANITSYGLYLLFKLAR